MFECPGDQQGANRQSACDKKHKMMCQVDTTDFLHENHSLMRNTPHAFGSELVKKSETENLKYTQRQID